MSQRLYETIRDAGIPVAYIIDVDRNNIQAVYAEEVSDDIKSQVASIISNFDWSDEAEQKWIKDKAKADAIARIESDEAAILLLRNSQKVVLGGFQAIAAKLNELIAAHNTKTGDTIEPVAMPQDFAQQVQVLVHVINQE